MLQSVSGVAAAMLQYINGWPDKPAPVRLAEFGTELPSLRMLPHSGVSELRRYADGTSVVGWPFSVAVRTRPASAGSDAAETLSRLADYICRAELPQFGDTRAALAIELLGAPERTDANASGWLEFTAAFRLIYAVLPQYD